MASDLSQVQGTRQRSEFCGGSAQLSVEGGEKGLWEGEGSRRGVRGYKCPGKKSSTEL